MSNVEIMDYLVREIGDEYLAAVTYQNLEAIFPISTETRLYIVNFAEVKHRDGMERLFNPQYWDNYLKTKEAIRRGDPGVEEITFQKVSVPDERYPKENRGWTLDVAFSSIHNMLVFR